jgi:hypothetical protein
MQDIMCEIENANVQNELWYNDQMNELKMVEDGLNRKINELRVEVRNSRVGIDGNREMIKANPNIMNKAMAIIWSGLEEVKA